MLNVLAKNGTIVFCNGIDAGMDAIIPNTVSAVVNIIKIGVPIILIIYGMLDLGKAVMANEEKEMKEAQKRLIKRILYAVLVFFVVAIVQWVFTLVDAQAAEGDEAHHSCITCFTTGKCNLTKN